MKHRLEIAVLCLAVLFSALAPSFPSTPASRAACPMAGCVKDTGESLGPVMPCCCDGKSLPAAGDAGASVVTRPHSMTSIVVADSVAPAALPALDAPGADCVHVAEHVPLYLRNASLLI